MLQTTVQIFAKNHAAEPFMTIELLQQHESTAIELLPDLVTLGTAWLEALRQFHPTTFGSQGHP